MRRPLALLALTVMTWSNATALQCSASTLRAADSAHTESSHAHAGHGSMAHPVQDDGAGHEHHGSTSHPAGQDCSVLMACGTAIGAPAAEAGPTLPETFAALEAPPLASPSTADLSLDPPPPRRLA